MAILSGIHPIAEALRAKRPLDRVLIAKGAGGAKLQEIIDLARASGTPIRFEDRAALDRVAGIKAHQGVVAFGSATRYYQLEDIAPASNLIVMLDGVEDPHNLGAIIRTANAAGAGGVVIGERRAVGLTDTVAKAAAGALEHLPVARVPNINQALRNLREMSYFIYGLDERGENDYNTVAWNERSVIVFGGEGEGLHDLVRRNCDLLVRIPMAGRIASLNVSVAAGIALFAWRAQCAK